VVFADDCNKHHDTLKKISMIKFINAVDY